MKKCSFEGRHKLDDKILRDPFIITAVKDSGDVYRIRPMLGGPTRVVNRRMLVTDPRDQLPTTTGTKKLDGNARSKTIYVSDTADKHDKLPPYIFLWEPKDHNHITAEHDSNRIDNPNEHCIIPGPSSDGHRLESEHPEIQDITPRREREDNRGPCRRSERRNKGQHKNPFNLPRSVLP